jgi:hypothetical protein
MFGIDTIIHRHKRTDMSTFECTQAVWRRSSYSGGNEGGSNCVEVAGSRGRIAVRDSKDPAPSLTFTPAQWGAFVAAVREGTIRFR